MRRRIFALIAISYCLAVVGVSNSVVGSDLGIWETRYGADSPPGDIDSDNDGQSNALEKLAGTNPFDAESVFSPEQTAYLPDRTLIEWRGAAGIRYQLEHSTSLSGTSWVKCGAEMLGNGEETYCMPEVQGTSAFFRIKALGSDSLRWDLDFYAPAIDTDEDGTNDLFEILAGSDPFNSKSAFKTPRLTRGNAVVIRWRTQPGKLYQVESQRLSSNTGWENEGEPYIGDGSERENVFVSPEGQQRAYRVQVYDQDTDGDGLTDWEERQLGLDPTESKTDPLGEGDWEEAQALINTPSTLELCITESVANVTKLSAGKLEIRRSGGCRELLVLYQVGGDATSGSDYMALSGTVTLPFGKKSVELEINPLYEADVKHTKNVNLILLPGENYSLGESVSQSVNVVRQIALNVRDHGAIGDGVTDDTAAIQSAIDYLEASDGHNTLYFPSGTYRLNSHFYTQHTTGTSQRRILQLGNTDLSGRDIFLIGDGDSKLYSTVSPTRAKMILAQCSFRSLHVEGLVFEKDEVLLDAMVGKEPNGASGITLIQANNQVVAGVSLQNCKFINCHRSITINVAPYGYNGKLKRFTVRDCEFLNPYGANTVLPNSTYGGGQQVYVSPWVAEALYEDCLFDGGTGRENTTGGVGQRAKDGCHFGTPLSVVFRRNKVYTMGVEAFYQENKHSFMGYYTNSFMVPEADGVSEAEIKLNFSPDSNIQVGSQLALRTGGTTNVFRVKSVDGGQRLLKIVNDGFRGNLSPGTNFGTGRIFLQVNESPLARVYENVFKACPNAGIVSASKAEIYNNLIMDCGIGVQIYDDIFVPVYRSSRGTKIHGNYIYSVDPATSPYYTFGIYSWADWSFIGGNTIVTPRSSHFCGVLTHGSDTLITKNRVYSRIKEVMGYNSPERSVGVAIGNNAPRVLFKENFTRGMDLGVGALQSNGGAPSFYLSGHTSLEDEQSVGTRAISVE